MFGMGLAELAVIAFVGVFVFGPERLPDLARQAARMLHKAKAASRSVRDELRSEMGPEYADLRLRDLDPRVVVRRELAQAMAEEDVPSDSSSA